MTDKPAPASSVSDPDEQPTLSLGPDDPLKPSTEPAEPAGSAEPAQPSESPEPSELAEPAGCPEPVEPAQHAGPGESAGSGEPANDSAESGEPVDVEADGADGDEPAAAGEMDILTAALASDDGAEPRRHWLRYPGVLGALAIIAVVILVPCGAGVLFATGGFADHGRYAAVPDACRQLDPGQVRSDFGEGLERFGHSSDGDSSTCTYQGSAAVGPSRQVRLAITRYGPKGPVSAQRMAQAGLRNDLAATDATHRRTLHGIADEAVRVRTGTGVTIYARTSNLVLELDATGDDADLPTRAVSAAGHIAARLRG